MFNKILLSLFIFSLALPYSAKSALIPPYFDITVVAHSVGGDVIIPFSISAEYPYNSYGGNFNIQTQQGAGSHTVYAVSGNGTHFGITEWPVQGWHATDISCTSSNPSVAFNIVQNEVNILAYPFSSVTCTFTNEISSSQTPVLIVPGVLGTDIHKDILKLWANIGEMLTDVGDQFMDPLRFNLNLLPTDNSTTIGEVVSNPSGVFDYTQGLINEFRGQGYVEGSGADATLFTFPYDWRYGVSGKDGNGVAVNEVALKQKIQDIIVQTGANKVDIVAHSTGGLLAKKYIINTPDHHVGKLVFVGVPNTGAPKAVKVLLTGDNFGIPWLADSEMKKIGQNLPVLYDLAPSQTYDARKGSFLKTIDQKLLAKDVVKNLNYTDAWALMTAERGANASALSGAEVLHTTIFDDFDLRTAGVDVYNIVGCKAGTVGQMVERRTPTLFGSPSISYDAPVETPGDGTVPLESATNTPVDASHKYYALKAEHGKMMSQDGPRQQIVNIVAGSSLATPQITQDISGCKLKGKAHAIFSPLDVEVIDQDGNRLGKREDGSVQNDIPNADFSIYGEHKFLYLPDDEGQVYQFHYKGTGNGTFTYKVQHITDNGVTETEVFSDIPVTTNLVGSLSNIGNQSELVLDTDGDGAVDQTVLPTTVLDNKQSQDSTSPITTQVLTGTLGQSGYYRSNVSVSLSAIDPVVDGVPAETSGVLDTSYKLDGDMSYKTYADPISITSEGNHTVNFYSTDKAGNVEAAQMLEFTIDKSAPEVHIKFNPITQDLLFTGVDAGTTVQDNDDVVLITDQAGNTTKLKLKDKDRKKKLKAEVSRLWYNGVEQDISKNSFKFAWEYGKQGQLKAIDQYVKFSQDFNIHAVYDSAKNQTRLEGRDTLGKINKIILGLALLKITTNKSNFAWSY